MKIGDRLGPYEITAAIGAGGMGEVYRATDTKLERKVAIKVLPEAFTQDQERLARFEREAKLLAQLHHPHIASIFGLEESGDAPALIMELVEGPTLAERLAEGPIPADEALPIARQIAQALEYAHEHGIIHRDLKPTNIKLTHLGGEDQVKILDFGLAKAMDPDSAAGNASASVELSHSPTMTLGGTVQGMILGSAGYMAPEQARGAAVDKRADIWAFGVVLYEMLSGERLFVGESVPDTLAGVLKGEIDLDRLPEDLPPAIRRLVRRCLERHPKNRLHSIADARIVLDEVLAGGVEEAPAIPGSPSVGRARSRWLVVLPWALVVVLAGLWVAQAMRAPSASEPHPVRALEFSPPRGNFLNAEGQMVFAPDGKSIVFTGLDPASGQQLWLRRLDQFDAVPLHGTDGASFPFWSPDSRSIGFFHDADATLRRYDLATGAVRVLAKTQGGGRGASWSADGSILFAPSSNSPIDRLAPNGGVTQVTKLDPGVLDGSHRFPVFLPDGQHFLFTFWSNQIEAARRVGGIYLGSLKKGIERRLTPDLSQAVLVGGDRLVVHRDGALIALPFDTKTFTITGAGTKIADLPLFSSADGALAASGTPAGDLVYATASGTTTSEFVWLDRQGNRIGRFGGERLTAQILALAPGGHRFAAQAYGASGTNIWIGNERRQVISRLSPDAVDAFSPVWSPDGRRVAYSTEAEGSQSVYLQEADGSRPAKLLLSQPDRDFLATGWSADGHTLFLQATPKRGERSEIWTYDLRTHAAQKMLSDPGASLGSATLSADGRWLAYTSDESGNPEVFVRSYPRLDRKWQISQGGAQLPHWRRDGRELLYLTLTDKAVMVVSVTAGRDGLEVGIPRQLFPPGSRLLAIAPNADDTRFLASIVPSDVQAEPVRVLLGWRRMNAGNEP